MSDLESPMRREILGRTAFVVGGLFVAPAFVTAQEKQRRLGQAASNVFSASQRELVRSLCDTIIPETDTAGALSAHVDDFISDTLELWCTAHERCAFLSGLDEFAQHCKAACGSSFTNLATEGRLAVLAPLDSQAAEARKKHIDPLPFFATLKELTLIGYYTSEAGCNAIGYPGPVGTAAGRDGPLTSAVWI